MKTKTKAIIIILTILALLLLGGVGRSHYKIKGLEFTISEMEENFELHEEKYVKTERSLLLLQKNFFIVVEDLYGEEEEEIREPRGPQGPTDEELLNFLNEQ
jgi:hypothetical protein